MSDDRIEETIFHEDDDYIDVDLSTVTELKDQKSYCKKMLKVLELEGRILRKRFIGTQTLADFVDADVNIKAEVSEFVGYNYGTINQCMILVDSAVMNLQKFHEGDFDEIDDGARGMFISLWYNIGVTHLDSVDHVMGELEGLEEDLLRKLVDSTDEEQIQIRRGTLH